MASPQVSSNGSDGSDVPKNTLVDEGLDLPTFPMHSCANSPESAKWGKKTTTPLAQKPPDPFVIPSIIDASGVQGRENSPHLRNGPSSDESLDSGIIDQEERDIVIHSRLHLRSAGESRRFEDSMHYLLDGLALGETAAVHRARLVKLFFGFTLKLINVPGSTSSVDILLRLENEDFIRKLKVYDFVPRLYIAFRQVGAGDGDVVSTDHARS